MTPKVSVVLPVRDGAPALDAALRSLACQTLSAFEVIVVDDGSRDDTPQIVRQWTDRDHRFRSVRTPRAGLVPALQRGLAEARAPFLARMDADDRCRPERLAAQLDFLRRSGLDGCGSQVRGVPANAVTERAAEYLAWLNAMTTWDTVSAGLFVECPLAHPTFLFRTEVVQNAGGYRDRGWPEDYDLLLRLWRAGHRFASVPRVLLEWHHGPRRVSRTHPAYSLDAFRACRVHHLRASRLTGRQGPSGERGRPASALPSSSGARGCRSRALWRLIRARLDSESTVRPWWRRPRQRGWGVRRMACFTSGPWPAPRADTPFAKPPFGRV